MKRPTELYKFLNHVNGLPEICCPEYLIYFVLYTDFYYTHVQKQYLTGYFLYVPLSGTHMIFKAAFSSPPGIIN